MIKHHHLALRLERSVRHQQWCFVLLCFALGPFCLNAQASISVNPGGLALGQASAHFQLFISSNVALQLEGILVDTKVSNTNFSGLGLGGGLRYFLTENTRPSGTYASLGWHFFSVDYLDRRDIEFNYTFSAASLGLGQQMLVGERVALEAGFGARRGFNASLSPRSVGVSRYWADQWLPFVQLAVGVVLW
ncbi:MAG: hypothetical protein HC821_03870 [Lewinella sp.]|nr:hypothetical protein [Lewinella sp.]